MKIVKVSVTAGRKFNDPTESFANFSFHLSAEVTIEEGENLTDLERLHSQLELMADEHKEQIVKKAMNAQKVRHLMASLDHHKYALQRNQTEENAALLVMTTKELRKAKRAVSDPYPFHSWKDHKRDWEESE